MELIITSNHWAKADALLSFSGLRVRVGNQNHVEVAGLKVLQKVQPGAASECPLCTSLDGWNIELQRLAPKVEAIPVQLATLTCEHGCQLFLTGFDVEAACRPHSPGITVPQK